MISALADNVFAVGRVGAAASERYIKHLRPGAGAHVFGAAHVPWFRIRKRPNFTYFEFRGFAREGALRLSDGDRREWQLIDRIAELKRLGLPIQSIAKALDMSKSTVQKYAVMCPEEPAPVFQHVEEPPESGYEIYYEQEDGAEECITTAIQKMKQKNLISTVGWLHRGRRGIGRAFGRGGTRVRDLR